MNEFFNLLVFAMISGNRLADLSRLVTVESCISSRK